MIVNFDNDTFQNFSQSDDCQYQFGPTRAPTRLPTHPTPIPTYIPTSGPTPIFNSNQIIDILFNSTMTKYNATNLEINVQLQNDFISLLEHFTDLVIKTDSNNNEILIEIFKIWAFSQTVDVDVDDNCNNKLENEEIDKYDQGLYYLSWIRFNVNFIDSNKKDELDSEIINIINLFETQLLQMDYFVNDTVSIYYCQSDSSNSSSTHDDFTMFSIVGTICIIGSFVGIAICASVDAMFCRRNEIFSTYSIISAAAYTVDFFSGVVRLFVFSCLCDVHVIQKQTTQRTFFGSRTPLCVGCVVMCWPALFLLIFGLVVPADGCFVVDNLIVM